MKLIDGYVKINNTTDFEDSSMATGLCALFGYFKDELNFFDGKYIDFWKFIRPDGYYQRCPNSKYDFSRDQTLVLWAGMKANGQYYLVDKWRVTGKDLFSPANYGHLRRCQNKKSYWFQDQWLKAEIIYHAKVTPLEEPNQLICMMMIAGDEYLKLWTSLNHQWQNSINKYFRDSFRNEPEFAAHMIKVINERVK